VWVWSFLAVPILFYSVIRFYPTIEAFWISLTNWDLLKPPQFIGLANYEKLFADPVFWKVFKQHLAYLLIGTPISLLLSFVIAYHLDRVRFMHGFIRALYFLPFLTTAAAMAWVWRWFYQPVPIGVINNALGTLGIPQQPFLRSSTRRCRRSWLTAIWAGLGFQIIIFMAGLRAIPNDLLRGGAHRRARRMGNPAQDHAAAAQADNRVSRRVLLDRLPAHFRPGLQHDHQRPGRAARLDQAAGADDLPDGLFVLRDGLCGGADGGAVHHPAVRIAAAALDPEGKEMSAVTQTPALSHANVKPGRILAWTLLFIGGLIMVTPLAFMFSTSLKTAGQVYDLG
jgi:ABC-type glycerol-3-phosphate transport system permease component